MPAQLDFSLLETVKDPELRDRFENLGRLMEASGNTTKPAPRFGGAKVIQFPIFPDTARVVSNDMARSALFSCVQGAHRKLLEKTVVATVDGVRIEFSGQQLNQDDHDMLMQLVFMARKFPVGDPVMVSAYAILKGLGRQNGGREHERLRQEIERLTRASVTLRGKAMNCTGHLIEESIQDLNTRKWIYRFNKTMHEYFKLDNYTLIDWERRKSLKRKDLARWLQLYIATHARPFPVKVEYLRRLSGSQIATLREFRRILADALKCLVENGDISDWWPEREYDLVHIHRGESATESQKRHLSRKK